MTPRMLKLGLFSLLLFCNFVLKAQEHSPTVLAPIAMIEADRFFSTVAWCPDEKCFVALEHFQTEAVEWEAISLFDAVTGTRIATLEAESPQDTTLILGFTPDGQYLITFDDAFALWDFPSRSLLLTIEDCKSFLTDFSQDGTRLVANCYEKRTERVTGQMWDLATKRELFSLPGYITWLFDENYLIRFESDKPYVYLHNAKTGEEVDRLTVESNVVAVVVGQTANEMLVFSDDISLWNVGTSEKLFSFPYDGESYWLADWNEATHRLTFTGETEIPVWDTRTGETLVSMKFPDGAGRYASAGWNGDETLMRADYRKPAGCDENCTYGIYIWDGLSGELFAEYDTAAYVPQSEWRTGYNQLIVWQSDTEAVIQDALTGEVLYLLPHPADSLEGYDHDIYVSSDGSHIITGSASKLYLWEIPTS